MSGAAAAAAAAAHRGRVLSLYSGILRAAKHFPSVKRDSIIRSIKEEFRANAALDAAGEKVAKCLAVAARGQSDLEAYRRAAFSQGGGGGGGGGDGEAGEVAIALKGAAHHHSEAAPVAPPAPKK